jgi:hypothetical protein
MAVKKTTQEQTADEEVLEVLRDVTPVQLPLFPDWPDDEESLEKAVRRHGGRLPGSDPRR